MNLPTVLISRPLIHWLTQSTLSMVVSLSYPTISGKILSPHNHYDQILTICRLLDKIAKEIMVCENKTVTRWEGSIGEYKNYLRKKMISMGQV